MAKKKIQAKKQTQKGQFIKYESIGLLCLTISALGLANLGWVGKAVDYICIFLAGDWHFLLPLYFIYIAILIMVRRAPIFWNIRQYGILMALLIILTWSHLNLYTALLDAHPQTKPDLFRITLDHIHELYKSETIDFDKNQSIPPVVAGGGFVGYILFSTTHYLFDTIGTLLVLITGLLTSMIMITKRSIVTIVSKVNRSFSERMGNGFRRLSPLFSTGKQAKSAKQKRSNVVTTHTVEGETSSHEQVEVLPDESAFSPLHEVTRELLINDFTDRIPQTSDEVEEQANIQTDPDNARITIRWPEKKRSTAQVDNLRNQEQSDSSLVKPLTFAVTQEQPYELPALLLLDLPRNNRNLVDQKDLAANAQKLKTTLESFGVHVNVNEIHRGPTVTRYEIQPAIGVKVSRIVNLADDLALALAARDIRIEAPIPGKSAIGIEVPNKEVAVVSLREVLEASEFKTADSKLTIGFGRDITGAPIANSL